MLDLIDPLTVQVGQMGVPVLIDLTILLVNQVRLKAVTRLQYRFLKACLLVPLISILAWRKISLTAHQSQWAFVPDYVHLLHRQVLVLLFVPWVVHVPLDIPVMSFLESSVKVSSADNLTLETPADDYNSKTHLF
jgi:hypothetical protein